MNDSTKPIRVGIVGAGANTQDKHIPGLRAIQDVEIVSVANRTRESSQRVASQFGIPTVYDSWEELVDASDTDAIVIGTWPYLHCPVTLSALAAGKHVLCEARMAMDAEEARAMLAAARQHPELVTQVVPSPFTLPVDATVKRLLAEAYLGQLLTLEVRATSGTFFNAEAPMHWRQDAALSGLNVMSLGIWYEALMRWIGLAETVTAKAKVFHNTRFDPLTNTEKPVTVPDHLIVVADMTCGAQATFVISSVYGHVQANDIMLFGTDGTLKFVDGDLWGVTRKEHEFSRIPVPAHESGRWRVEEEFIGAIRNTETIKHTTFADGVKYMEFTEAVARCIASGRTERVGPEC